MTRIYTVGEVNRYIRSLITDSSLLAAVSVRGEVSNCKYHSSGHLYFSIKDEHAAISCVMFAGSRAGLSFRMKDGDRVVVSGRVDVYEREGRYQLYALRIEAEGEGLLFERFRLLKKKLEAEGLFDPSVKRPVPAYAKTVGVVTAPTGAAIRDIQNISARRNPFVQLLLYPARVQGDGAAESIVEGIRALDGSVDVIIVGRGGGSIEDLWAFNEEIVARAIRSCGTPVISAVGHETDTTIADYAADLRAPTPSAAAELAVFDYERFRQDLVAKNERLWKAAKTRLLRAEHRMTLLRERIGKQAPRMRLLMLRHRAERLAADMAAQLRHKTEAAVQTQVLLSDRLREAVIFKTEAARQKTGALETALESSMRTKADHSRHRYELVLARYEGLSPLKRLHQGYAFAERGDGGALTSIRQARIGEELHIYLKDGRVDASVTDISGQGGIWNYE